MKNNRRWMKWIIKADTDAVSLPWERSLRRKTIKNIKAKQLRAA